jgi:hypothetical protein
MRLISELELINITLEKKFARELDRNKRSYNFKKSKK